MIYAGIGSRATPPSVLVTMTAAARRLCARGYTLRSGAAAGADAAFEEGAGDLAEIWLPWRGFNGHASKLTPSPEAFTLAATLHPAWSRCSRRAQALHARNCHQVLGATLTDPVDFVLCWTRGGSGTGGTGQAIRLACARSVPVFDLGQGFRVLQDLGDFIEHSIQPLCDVFVFGSNLAGRHGKGAALFARNHHGAVYGIGAGRTGQSYAVPTKDAQLRTLPLNEIDVHVHTFLAYASANPMTRFQVTRIGCGLAGYRDADIAPLFACAPANCHLPAEWRNTSFVTGKTTP